ncbi:SCP2 domain-containing protein [Massilia sp. CF038]|uniref:ubiquinone anaerobic biosynthesis accessory factor UbiT n=1 Tax=Massilia sp. CF038 TaxID=1881045 RepID=UPI000917F887|nr:SCP2 sterol-binding domain-containing protein [Massilia sp. CF038]SHG72807.1 Predicted lipid carrier protein YhbT, contains SCP2 domain [Massilia sp. CF038]
MSWRGCRPAPRPLPSLAALTARLPVYPGSWLFARALTAVLAPQLPTDTRVALQGRHLRLRVLDLGLAFDVLWRGQRFEPADSSATPDLTVGASLHDLWLLARREEDPDSLFFSRRLTLEGDTELGLIFKNTMDAFDGAVFEHFLARLSPSKTRKAAP